MLPLLSPLPTSVAEAVPPPSFRAVEGLQSAWVSQQEPHFAQSAENKPTVAQLAGVRFEKKARAVFEGMGMPDVRVNPWFTFRDAYGTRWCQPDVLLVMRSLTTIVEIKHTHTTDAWFQLRKLYQPVVEKALNTTCRCLVLVEHYDPSVPWPEPIELLASSGDLRDWLRSSGGRPMGVLSWVD